MIFLQEKYEYINNLYSRIIMNRMNFLDHIVSKAPTFLTDADISSYKRKENKDMSICYYKKNWIDLNLASKNCDEWKINQLNEYFRHRKSETDFIDLMHKLRLACLAYAYFPNIKEEYKIYYCGWVGHSGWLSECSKREHNLLYFFFDALCDIVINKKYDSFIEIDKEFGMYRYQRWLISNLNNRQKERLGLKY